MITKIIGVVRAIVYRPFFERIGFPTYICKPLALYHVKGISIGNKVRIYPGVRMETHSNGKIEIQDDVSIGQNFHITSGGDEKIIIGKKTTISGNVFVTNIDHKYQEIGKHILEQPFLIKKTEIGENCFIGYGACIQAGTILGKQCIVGANAVVRGVFPDYSVIVGVPAKVVKQYKQDSNEWVRIGKENNGGYNSIVKSNLEVICA